MSATVIVLFCALICPLSMGLMMLFMRKSHSDSRRGASDEAAEAPDDRGE